VTIRDGNRNSKVIRYEYPEFLYVENLDGTLNITLYNYNNKHKSFSAEPFSPSGRNFGNSTFYVKKEYVSDTHQIEEFFRVKRNLWKKIRSNKNHEAFQYLRVTNNIVISDTILIIDKSSYAEMLKIYDYFEVK
jgi:hypothetical protein